MNRIVLSIIMIIITFFIIFILSKKYNLNKNQRIIFWLLVFFWTGITVVRSYRKLYAVTPLDVGGLGLSAVLAVQITSAYGLVSFLIRTPIFFSSDMLNKKKVFIQISVLISILSSLYLVVNPSFNALYISSVSMGISASMLAIFNVLFSETFSKENATISASILAVAPLLAEFLSAPIQYIATHDVNKNFKLLWLISMCISIITLVLTFLIKEEKYNTNKFSFEKVKTVVKFKGFIFVCLVGIMIAFIKFSTSGANMVAYSKTELSMPAILIAYMDIVFAFSQLLASIFVGTFFVKRIGLEKTLILGILSSMVFYVIALLSKNYLIVYISYIFNGFGYGIAYTSLISMALQYFDRDFRNISMGIFQFFFGLGIYFGDRVYIWILKLIPNGIFGFSQSQSIFLVVILVGILSMTIINFKVEKRV